ncbi:MAG TPA: alginate lyase family protein [Mycobacteriales bacterium]|nr:alginate lyase family protein [Mycobacteriales bacterium]
MGVVALVVATTAIVLTISPDPDKSVAAGNQHAPQGTLFQRGPAGSSTAAPAVFLVDGARLAAEKAGYARGDAAVVTAVTALLKRADRDLAVNPVSATAKSQTPPSGDKHDYMSLSVYAWPNPTTPDGLPYVLRDGQRNPAIATIPDKENLLRVTDWAQELGYAYYFSGNEDYATKARALLAAWFLDPSTKMNPNLTYAQAVKGVSTGQPGGIIDGSDLPKIVDAAGLLAGSRSWTAADAAGLRGWFGSYLSWLRTSSQGAHEAATINNHATWYADQIVDYALYTGNISLATQTAAAAQRDIISLQIQPDGTQPAELDRAESWSYSTYNVAALARLAQLAGLAHVDLWHFQAANGASIRKALDLVAGYATRLPSWPYPQSRPATWQYLVLPLYAAATRYGDPAYAALAAVGAASLPAMYPAAVLLG